jgi:hypothetical protein
MPQWSWTACICRLLELTWNGQKPLALPVRERSFLLDGDD